MRHRRSSTVDDGVMLDENGYADEAPTEVIPFSEFSALDEVGFRHNAAFTFDVDILFCPELDDQTDEQPLVLLPSSSSTKLAVGIGDTAPSPRGVTRPGRHRTSSHEPRASQLLVATLSGGIAAAIAQGVLNPSEQVRADNAEVVATASATYSGIEVVAAPDELEYVEHQEEFARGVAYAAERAEREARLLAPTSAMPTRGILTSAFGWRWGELHGGLDIANAVGTPVYAAADGLVIAAGPTAGYGMWVKLRHSDGTVTLYGHINTAEVTFGQWVMAGDLIATMGNRGNSTGPHLHFEVHRGGSDRIDPAVWLRQRGTDLGMLG